MSYPSGGYSVPHRLSEDELLRFLELHAGDAKLTSLIQTRQPPYGVIVSEGPRSFLAWWPQSAYYLTDLAVIDVTGLPVVASVNQAPYEAQDSSFVQETIDEVRALASQFQSSLNLALGLAVAYLVLQAVREARHA